MQCKTELCVRLPSAARKVSTFLEIREIVKITSGNKSWQLSSWIVDLFMRIHSE